LLAAIGTIILLNPKGLRERISGQAKTERIESLAVLPLKNLSGDPSQEYFADGMTEELIATLARIESIRVISRTSVMEYKDARKPLPNIAKELNVDAVLEGSVLQDGGRVRITAQLIDGRTDRHIWGESYERDLRNVLALQNEVTRSIVQEIKIKLTPQEKAHLEGAPAIDPEAYQAYLRGLDYRARPEISEENLRLAVEMFDRAIELDPKFVNAYTELSIAHSAMFHFGHDRTEDRLKKAKDAATRAFELQPDLAEGHVALGYYYYWGRRDYAQALREFGLAVKDLPNSSKLRWGTGSVQRRQGMFNESIGNIKTSA
jgi:TolB-like protein